MLFALYEIMCMGRFGCCLLHVIQDMSASFILCLFWLYLFKCQTIYLLHIGMHAIHIFACFTIGHSSLIVIGLESLHYADWYNTIDCYMLHPPSSGISPYHLLAIFHICMMHCIHFSIEYLLLYMYII